jgi:hypothetical protein
MFFFNLYSSIDRFLIRTRVKYPEILKGNNFKIPRSNFFKFSMDRRTIVPILFSSSLTYSVASTLAKRHFHPMGELFLLQITAS